MKIRRIDRVTLTRGEVFRFFFTAGRYVAPWEGETQGKHYEDRKYESVGSGLLLAGGQMMHGQYYITELGTGASSYAAGINNNGQVIGTDESGALDQAVIWQANTKPVYITSPSHDSGTGMAIADSGAVVGYFTTTSGTNLPFLYSGGTVTKLPLANAMPYAVNSSNQVVVPTPRRSRPLFTRAAP